MVLLTLKRVMDNEAWRVRVQFPLERKNISIKKNAATSDRFFPFVFTPVHRFIFLNDSTFFFPPKDKKITVIHL